MPPSTDTTIICKTPLSFDGKTKVGVSKQFKLSEASTSLGHEQHGPSKRYRYTYASEKIDIPRESGQSSMENQTTVDGDNVDGTNCKLTEAAEPVDAGKIADANILTWAQCDICGKWRQLPSDTSIDHTMAFSCADVKGWNCDIPEQPASGQFEVAISPNELGPEPAELLDPANSISSSRQSSNVCSQTSALCPGCGAGVPALEDHYRLSPLCRPPREITPYWVSGLVLDLSDRIPYRAVTHKDLRIWRKFASRARSCSTYRGAARQLLWLYEQLRPAVLCEGWRAARQDQFRRDCESCDEAQLAVQLVNQVELEAIDWVEIHRLWAQERGADGYLPPSASRPGLGDRRAVEEGKKEDNGSRSGASKTSESERFKRRRAARARWDRCKAARESVTSSANVDGCASRETTEEKAGEVPKSHGEEVEYTLGSLVEVTLDDGEQALAIITAIPDLVSGTEKSGFEVAFLDSRGLIVQNDRLRLPLPNRFVTMTLPCLPCRPGVLPPGWIPAAVNPSTCYYIGPDGHVCKSRQEMLSYAATASATSTPI
mmetsp:Transcript_489/g.1023  ORF Transcript_489/g.1023 Transcript_489/m.1023 type:complete len:545 (-) Transcript_489:337-1971(-)